MGHVFWKVEMEGLWELAHLFFFEHFAHFHFRSHLQTLINRESHQIKLYQSQRCRRQQLAQTFPMPFSPATSCSAVDSPQQCLYVCTVLWEWQVLLRSWRAKIQKYPTHNRLIQLSLCVANLEYVCRRFAHSCCLRLCVHVHLYACEHVRGDKRAVGVSRGEGLWNMESSRVVLFVTPVL